MPPKKIRNDFYTVEKILDDRKVNGVTEYFIKWQGFPSSDNSWEPESNFLSNSYEYLEQYRRSKLAGQAPNPAPAPPRPAQRAPAEPQFKKIIGIKKDQFGMKFVIQFKDDTVLEVEKDDANRRFPQQVIAFYESTLHINTPLPSAMPSTSGPSTSNQ